MAAKFPITWTLWLYSHLQNGEQCLPHRNVERIKWDNIFRAQSQARAGFVNTVSPQSEYCTSTEWTNHGFPATVCWICGYRTADTEDRLAFPFFLFFFFHLYWSIIALQWCVSFCFITKVNQKIWNAYILLSPSSCISLPPSLSHPSVVTKHWADLPVLWGCLGIYFLISPWSSTSEVILRQLFNISVLFLLKNYFKILLLKLK